MSNFCNRNTLEYRISQNDPEYVGLPEWFIVEPGSPSEVNLTTQPRKYLFVPEGEDRVIQKSQDGKDQADALEQQLQEEAAREGAVELTDSTLEPTIMATRAAQQVDTDDLNAEIERLTNILAAMAAANGFAALQNAIEAGLGEQPPLTNNSREERAKTKIAAGLADGPAPVPVQVNVPPGRPGRRGTRPGATP